MNAFASLNSNSRRIKRNSLYRCMLMAGLAVPFHVHASSAADAEGSGQQAAADSDPMETAPAAGSATMLDSVTVTASKRTTLIEKTPIAISAITQETLSDLGALDIKDYAAQVPGLRIQYNGPGSQRISLRGVNAAGEATVGTYYDETPISGSTGVSSDAGGRAPDMPLFDVDRIEVLRGPQGTLYGASSMGGAIRILYEKPKQEYEGSFQAAYEITDGGDPTHVEDVMVNAPLIADTLAARATLFNRETGGYVDNTFLGISNVNSSRAQGGRFQLRFTPNQDLTVDLSHYRSTSEAYSSTWHPSEGEYKQLSQVKLPYDDDTSISSLTLNWDLGWANLTANSSYQDRKSTYISDDSYYIATYLTPARCQSAGNGGVPCSDERLQQWYDEVNSLIPAALIHDGTTTDWTNEIRLSSADSQFLDWTVGAFGQNRKNWVASEDAPADPQTGIIITPWELFYRRQIWDVLEQKAVYGEATWHATAKLNVTAGARYYDYKKTVTGITDIPWDMIGAGLRPLTTVDASEDGWLKKLTVDYNAAEHLMFYATAADGFRPGGANQVIGLPEVLTAYSSDKLWNYEVGMKSYWLDRSLFFNAALYQIDWDDMQVRGRTLNGAFSFLANAGAARMRGVELEWIYRPIMGLDLTANFNYVNAELTEDQISDVVTAPGRNGDQVPDIPEVTGMIAAAYRRGLTDTLDGMIRLDANYVGKTYSSFRPDDPYRATRDAYTMLNFRTGVESADDRWSVYLYVRNLTNKLAINQLSLSSTPPYGSATSLMPRTIGINFAMNFY
ncbi:TonB-dependent receptor [Pseudoxanthomonas wuyuanensis]